jgi:molybdate transport system substrate-binding protein
VKQPIRRLAAASSALLAVLLALPAGARETERPHLLVFAAASLTDVLGDLSKRFERQAGGVPVKLSFAASSALARQIEAGGQADVFISADQEWMDYLQQRGLIEAPSRRDLAGNYLVLIAPADSTVDLRIAPGFPLVAALGGGRLATGDPDTVPVGRYARAALASLGLWDEVRDRLVRADNVRSALMFVARGESPLGIVYASDALADSRVHIVDTFPETTHSPVSYPGATTRGARAEAIAYLDFLASPAVSQTWRRFGFRELKK